MAYPRSYSQALSIVHLLSVLEKTERGSGSRCASTYEYVFRFATNLRGIVLGQLARHKRAKCKGTKGSANYGVDHGASN